MNDATLDLLSNAVREIAKVVGREHPEELHPPDHLLEKLSVIGKESEYLHMLGLAILTRRILGNDEEKIKIVHELAMKCDHEESGGELIDYSVMGLCFAMMSLLKVAGREELTEAEIVKLPPAPQPKGPAHWDHLHMLYGLAWLVYTLGKNPVGINAICDCALRRCSCTGETFGQED
jgi:hypothetical protein